LPAVLNDNLLRKLVMTRDSLDLELRSEELKDVI
jgi:hypothetical protein